MKGDPGKAVEVFIRSTGAPFDAAMKESPWWPAMTAVAHTLPYDMALVGDSTVPADRLAKIGVPTLVEFFGQVLAWMYSCYWHKFLLLNDSQQSPHWSAPATFRAIRSTPAIGR